MESDALIVSRWGSSRPLWYAQHIEGQRPDLTAVDDRTRLDQGLGDVTDVNDAHLSNGPAVIRVDPIEIAALGRHRALEPGADGAPNRRSSVVARRVAGR